MALTATLLLATLALGVWGMQRSLWLDEAWVANSVMEPSLSGMFYYPEWLQSTPPLFLVLMRAAVKILGASNVAFRAVPLAFALVATGTIIALTKRLLSPAFAMLACVMLVFHPVVIEYSHTAKQYSAELMSSVVILLVTALYLENPVGPRFWRLAGAFVLLLPLAWSTAFLLPGVAIVVLANGGWRRTGLLVLLFGATLTSLYLGFIRQNVSPELRGFWIATAQKPSTGLAAALIFCVAATIWAVYRREWIQIAALLPCLLFAVADWLHLYPAEPRTRLFVLPCFLVAAAMIAEDLYRWLLRVARGGASAARFAGAAIWLIAICVGVAALRREIRVPPDRPQEDLQGAVRLLREKVQPGDTLLVHASVAEGFRLYAKMDGWRDSHALFGDTGWPCCARNHNAAKNSSDPRAVFADIDRMVPHDFSGRVWMFHSARHTHWAYIGNDEGDLWRGRLRDRGCAQAEPDLNPVNVVITAMDCVDAK